MDNLKIIKVRKKVKIRDRSNQVPQLTKDAILESDTNTRKTLHIREPGSQPFCSR